MIKKVLNLMLVTCFALCLALMAACGGTEPNSEQDSESNAVDIVEFDKYSLEMLSGESYALTVTGIYGKTCVWTTDAPAVATVADGVITAVGGGSATITLTVDGEQLKCTVTVTEELTGAVNFAVNKEINSVYVGYTKQLTPMLVKGDKTLDPTEFGLRYASDAPTVVKVDADGTITALKTGLAKITATVTVDGVDYSSALNITVKTLNSVQATVDKENISVSGEYSTAEISTVYYESDGDDFVEKTVPLTYETSDASVATVSGEGIITGVGEGTATITVTANGTSASVNVKVFGTYEIVSTPYDFMNIASDLNGYYELGNDIDFSGIAFEPLGTTFTTNENGVKVVDREDPFTGILNGNGYSVKNITHTVTGGNTDLRFIFGYLGESGVITNIGFENIVFGGTRAARSAGVVWINNGTIKNVKVSLTVSGTGISQNEWGFGGVTTRNNGLLTNCFVDMTATGNTDYTGGIFTVNSVSAAGKGAVNNVALVNKSGIKAHIHTGSFGNFSNNEVCLTTEEVYECLTNFNFSNSKWAMSKVVAPSLKNGGNTVDGEVIVRKADDTSNPLVIEKADGLLYYYDGSAKVKVNYTLDDGKITVPYNTVNSILTAGENDKFYLTHKNGTTRINVIVYTAALGADTTYETFRSTINADLNGYYILTGDVTLGNINGAGHAAQVITSDFGGTLNGNGHKISYSSSWVSGVTNHDKSLFATLTSTAVIKNLNVNAVFDGTNGVRRAAIAKTNNGLIENCFIDVTFANVGQGSNADYSSAGVVMTNSGRINNSLVKFTYTGSSAIDSKLLLVCSLNETSGVITNTSVIVYSEKVDAQTFVYQWTNKGVKQNDWIWRTENEAFNNDVNFKWTVKTGYNGYYFILGDAWNYDESGIYFFGSKVIG